jgi:hypothetical protein
MTLVFAITLVLGDVYIFSSLIVAATIPWVLVSQRDGYSFRYLPMIFVLLGLLLGCSHILRSQSGTGVALFVVILLFASRVRSRRKAVLALALVVGVTVPLIAVTRVSQQRQRSLLAGTPEEQLPAHPLWHSVYIGFGFLSNPDIPAYRDEVAMARVAAVDPNARFVSRRYEQILRQESIRFVRTHPKFVIITVGAKAGMIFESLFLLATPFALLGRMNVRRSTVIHVAFWIAILFNCLPGLIAIPNPKYILGAVTFAACYGVWRWLGQNASSTEDVVLAENAESASLAHFAD